MATSRPEWIWYLLALAVGMLGAILSLHTDNLQFTVLFIFVHCVVFGCARPANAWRWACLIAACIPLSLAFNTVVTLPSPRELGFPARLFLGPLVVFFKAPHAVHPAEIGDSCLALLPALAGAYTGALLSRLTVKN